MLVGLFSFTIVSVPSTCALYVSIVFLLKMAESTPEPIAGKIAQDSLLFVANAHLFYRDAAVTQGIWNLRDAYKIKDAVAR